MMMIMTAQYVAATSAPCSVAQHAWKTQLRKIPANCTFFAICNFLMRSLPVPVSEMFCIKMYNWLSYKEEGSAKLDLLADPVKLN